MLINSAITAMGMGDVRPEFLKTTCSYSSYLLEEWRVFSQVFGNHVETEKVTVDALSCHCQTVHVLVLLGRLFEQLKTLFSLNGRIKDKRKCNKQLKGMIFMLDRLSVQSKV